MRRVFRILKYILFRTRYLLISVIVIISFLLVYFLSPIFKINDVALTSFDGKELTYINIEKINADLQYLTNKRFLSVNTLEVKNIVDGYPFVDKVLVTKIFPNIVNIYVSQRKPFISLSIDEYNCVLLDQEGYVVKIAEGNCDQINEAYSPIPITIPNPNITFVEDSKTTYYTWEIYKKIIQILNNYGFSIEKITVKESIVTVYAKTHTFIFSISQDIEVQLARFVSTISQIEKDRIKFSSLDLRFERPVAKK